MSCLFAKKMPSNIYHLTAHLTTQRGNKLLEIVLKDNNYRKKKKYNNRHRICPRLLVSSEEEYGRLSLSRALTIESEVNMSGLFS